MSASLERMREMAPAPGGYDEAEMHRILERACAAAGLDSRGSRLLRGHTNAVVLLEKEQVVAKIARKGSRVEDVTRKVEFVRRLMAAGFPTVPLHPVDQPVLVDGHAVTFWTYLPQPEQPVEAQQLAQPLRKLHNLPLPPLCFPEHDNVGAIRRSLSAITCLTPDSIRFMEAQTDRLAAELRDIRFPLARGLIQGDPQHRNALHAPDGGAVLCDWDTVAYGQPEWDLVTIEVHCRRFGFGQHHYRRFADSYGWDVTAWPGYPVLAGLRELRMITTNARKVHHAPASLAEVHRRVEALRKGDRAFRWNIL
ncbi:MULTISPECIES: phosphotransferase [unclassified Streptomyces]|nr:MULTISPECIES: phosphotransferase [unclassified Streptomyces]WKX17096.1 phosphotransferase [Streptomyces sp. HUAS CX7]